jgi:hypothetical protein
MPRLLIAVSVVLGVGSTVPLLAQKAEYKGFAQCVDCHDHDDQKLWAQKKDGPPPNNHLNSLAQMENTKSNDFAKAVGLDPKDMYDPARSMCLKCHATVVKAPRTLKGVYCETCHGAGSLYFEPHKEKGAYQKGGLFALGMLDVVKKPAAWAPMCMKCHVMDNQALIAAKHPSGDDFDLGAKFSIVMAGHWKSTYADKGQISSLGKVEAAKLVAARKTNVTTAAPVAAAPPPAAPAAPPAVTPPPPSPTPPPAAGTTPATPAPQAPPVRRGSAPPQPVAPPPPPASRSAPTPAPQVARAPAPMPGLPVAMTPAPPAAPEMTADSMMSSLAGMLPQSPAAAVAALQGRAIALVDSLLRRGGRMPIRVTPPEKKTEYRGPDADLLRLQEDVLSLAIEALKTAPPAAGAAPASK